jgi:cellulose synthase/poly-beta-1,6-N-acetylglucosamine synthase-like glycosyltransferase
MHFFATMLTWVYAAICALLTLFGLYRVVLLAAGLRARMPRAHREEASPSVAVQLPRVGVQLPRVTVQLPLYNERWVARRLIQSVASLDYPRDRLQIQLLDDSTDRTAALTRRCASVLRRRGYEVDWIHRTQRDGYKAGALARGLETATGDAIAIFDADFVPRPDFLRCMLPTLLQPRVGAVQARWGHLNRDAHWFTRYQAILLDGHFAIEQPARSARDWLLAFNGTAGIWRREAIESSGGWQSDTLTEDLDLSLRAQLAGWRIVYRHDVVVPAELPADSDSLRTQQRRWTKGGVQTARKMLPRLLGSRLPWRVKFEATLHLTSYLAYPLLVLLALLRTPARRVATDTGWLGLLPGEWVLLACGTLPLVAFYAVAQRESGATGGWRRWTRDAFPAMALGAGLALGNAIAVVEGLFGRGVRFERTPKRGTVRASSGRLRHAWRYPSPASRLALLELSLLVYLLLCKLLFARRTLLGEVSFLAFFAFGLSAMALPSLRAAKRGHWAPAPSAP